RHGRAAQHRPQPRAHNDRLTSVRAFLTFARSRVRALQVDSRRGNIRPWRVDSRTMAHMVTTTRPQTPERANARTRERAITITIMIRITHMTTAAPAAGTGCGTCWRRTRMTRPTPWIAPWLARRRESAQIGRAHV